MKNNNKKGFTIIEVVLVLAIAGLIFMVVFLAVPRLQRGQRDSARKRHLSSLQAAIDNYSANNNGHLPSVDELSKYQQEEDKQDKSKKIKVSSFIYNYMLTGDSEFVDPSGVTDAQDQDTIVTYEVKECPKENAANKECISSGDWKEYKNEIYFKTKAVCGDKENHFKDASSRKMAVFMKLENGGYHCLSNK